MKMVEILEILVVTMELSVYVFQPRGGGVFPEKFDRGVRPAS